MYPCVWCPQKMFIVFSTEQDYNAGTSEFQPWIRPVVAGVAVSRCAKARQAVPPGPTSLTGLCSSTQKSHLMFLNLAPPQLKLCKSICSLKLRNCPKQLDSPTTIKQLCLHLFLNVTKWDFCKWMQNGTVVTDETAASQAGQESTNAWLDDFTDLVLPFG